MYKTFNYDTSAYETAPFIPQGIRNHSQDEILAEIRNRLEREKKRKELHVYFYRIGHRIAYPLPVSNLPELPEGIPGLGFPYPWSIWLAWELRERWEVFHYAWRNWQDNLAGSLLQKELAALEQWDKTFEGPGTAHLCTGHLASLLSLYLANQEGWAPDLYQKAFRAAQNILDRDVMPWFAQVWRNKDSYTVGDMHNIPCIILTSAAALSQVTKHPAATELNSKAESVYQAWLEFKAGHYSEGTSYDAFFMDSLSIWLDSHPKRETLLAQGKDIFQKTLTNWVHHTLPGRPDLHAPLADVEPEMFFWMNVTEKFTKWYGWGEGTWILKQIAPVRLPSSALVNIPDTVYKESQAEEKPTPKPEEHAASITLRTGWDSKDLAAFIGLSRTDTGHLHYDNGQVVIGAYNRFWITDPGYQQYRPGPECDFTLGIEAHNVPVINSIKQSKREGKLIKIENIGNGCQHGSLDISECYENLPEGTRITRDIWLFSNDSRAIVVQDRIQSSADLKVDYYWQGGNHLAWSFIDSMTRLSDGERALWIHSPTGFIKPEEVYKHTGSRGSLTLRHSCHTENQKGIFNWVFYFDNKLGWSSPKKEILELTKM
jgi:hypothetical protein